MNPGKVLSHLISQILVCQHCGCHDRAIKLEEQCLAHMVLPAVQCLAGELRKTRAHVPVVMLLQVPACGWQVKPQMQHVWHWIAPGPTATSFVGMLGYGVHP
jgi:hypothetical protein